MSSSFAFVTGRRLLFSSLAVPVMRRQGLTLGDKLSLMRQTVLKRESSFSKTAMVANRSAIFEISLLCCVSHYKHIGLCLMRNVFQTFRPLLITIVMGNLLKIGAFLLQFPIGFYAIFFFEAFYGIMQLAISFVFVCFFHNGMMMQRSRVLSKHWLRHMRARLAQKAAMI